jgi:hypothetical protein
MSKPDDLCAYLFDGQRRPLTGELRQWLEAAPRFVPFVEVHRDKIRKKIRVTHEAEGVLDLRAELEVAAALLSDRRLTVAYEPYASAKRRGPDFAVTYRTNHVFNVEVTRLRAEAHGEPLRLEERLRRILLAKLGQMQPGMPNLLVIHTPPEAARTIDLEGFFQALKARVEAKEAALYAANGYLSPAAFYKDFLRLSAVLLWAREPRAWVNKPARPALEAKALRLVSALARQSPGNHGTMNFINLHEQE